MTAQSFAAILNTCTEPEEVDAFAHWWGVLRGPVKDEDKRRAENRKREITVARMRAAQERIGRKR